MITQNKTLLSGWQEKLDHDVQTLNIESNVVRFRKVLSRHGFECPQIRKLSIKELVLSNKSLEKVVIWASIVVSRKITITVNIIIIIIVAKYAQYNSDPI